MEKLLEKNGIKAWGVPPEGSIDDKMQLTLGPGNIKGFDTIKPTDGFIVPVWVEYGTSISNALYMDVDPIEITAQGRRYRPSKYR